MAIISFDPEAWASRNIGFPRLVQSVLFDISLHNFRTGTSMSLGHYKIITADLGEQAMRIADMLAQAGKIEQDDNGIWSPEAIEEWNKAEKLRLQRARGGSSRPKREPARPAAPVKIDAQPAPPPPSPPPPAPPTEEDAEAVARAERAMAAKQELAANVQRLAEAWNAMAQRSGLTLIAKMNEKRCEQAAARIKEYGIDTMLKAVESIPASPFLVGNNERGWKMDIDSLLQKSTCLKLIEGKYHNAAEGGKASGWR